MSAASRTDEAAVEQVARALYVFRGGDESRWDSFADSHWNQLVLRRFHAEARAAVAAARPHIAAQIADAIDERCQWEEYEGRDDSIDDYNEGLTDAANLARKIGGGQ